jgi:hypothetical protein
MRAPPGPAIVAVGLLGRAALAERPPSARRGATGPAKRHETGRPEAREQTPLAVTQRVPRWSPNARTAAGVAVVSATDTLVISVQIAEAPGAVVRHPREAHPGSPERAAACTAAASDLPEVMVTAQ